MCTGLDYLLLALIKSHISTKLLVHIVKRQAISVLSECDDVTCDVSTT